jgi:hypothetical protein
VARRPNPCAVGHEILTPVPPAPAFTIDSWLQALDSRPFIVDSTVTEALQPVAGTSDTSAPPGGADSGAGGSDVDADVALVADAAAEADLAANAGAGDVLEAARRALTATPADALPGGLALHGVNTLAAGALAGGLAVEGTNAREATAAGAFPLQGAVMPWQPPTGCTRPPQPPFSQPIQTPWLPLSASSARQTPRP